MNFNKGLISAIAREARHDFETDGIPRDLLARLYLCYRPQVVDINDFLDRRAEEFPKGNCDLASVYLQHRIGIGEPVYGYYRDTQGRQLGHAVLHLGCGQGVDITADQFGGPRVYVGPLVTPWEYASLDKETGTLF